MHSLRAIMGDSLFFPALKAFATSPKYTYLNTVNTSDVEKHFSAAYGKSLKPFFQLMLYTTQKLKINAHRNSDSSFTVRLDNLDMDIPVEIQTSSGLQKVVLSSSPITISSSTLDIDPKGFYMKEIIE